MVASSGAARLCYNGNMADKITWNNERRKLKELRPWERNPLQIKGDQARRLAESFEHFGQVETIAIGPENEVYNGHQRLNVLRQKYGDDYEVEVRVASRALSEKEREKLTVFLHKGAAGEWDFDILANEFDLPDLLTWGFTEWDLGVGEVIGATSDDVNLKRQNNNMNIIGTGANVALNFGDIMVVLPSDLYQRVLSWVTDSRWDSRAAGMQSLLEAGLNAENISG